MLGIMLIFNPDLLNPGGTTLAHIIVEFLVALTPSILGLASFITGSWLIDAFLRARDEPGVDVESFFRTIIKILQFCGMAIGILCFATLIAVYRSDLVTPFYADLLTLILLGVIGFVLLIAPIAKSPWAAMVAFIVAIIAAAAVAFLTPTWIIGLLPFDFKWLIIGVFIIIGLFVFISLKWLEDLLKAFALILASRPVTVILMIIGIIQAALIIFFPGGILYFIPI